MLQQRGRQLGGVRRRQLVCPCRGVRLLDGQAAVDVGSHPATTVGRVSTDVNHQVTVDRAKDGARASLPRVVLLDRLFDEMVRVEAAAVVAEMADVTDGVAAMGSDEGGDVEKKVLVPLPPGAVDVGVRLGLELARVSDALEVPVGETHLAVAVGVLAAGEVPTTDVWDLLARLVVPLGDLGMRTRLAEVAQVVSRRSGHGEMRVKVAGECGVEKMG